MAPVVKNPQGRRQWQPTAVLLPGKSHARRSLVDCSPWGREGSDTTERLHFHFSLSCIGEGNGSPLQCSCLENLRDGRAWWAAVYGVAQSPTLLKRLSSSSSSSSQCRKHKRPKFDLWVGKISWRRAWQPILVVLPGESNGQRSLVGSIGFHRVGYNWSNLAGIHASSIILIFLLINLSKRSKVK